MVPNQVLLQNFWPLAEFQDLTFFALSPELRRELENFFLVVFSFILNKKNGLGQLRVDKKQGFISMLHYDVSNVIFDSLKHLI